jgi:hypothetical protein
MLNASILKAGLAGSDDVLERPPVVAYNHF